MTEKIIPPYVKTKEKYRNIFFKEENSWQLTQLKVLLHLGQKYLETSVFDSKMIT